MEQNHEVLNLQGAYINYKETADKRVIFEWIDKEVKRRGIAGAGKERIDAIISNCTILSIPVAERRRDPYSCYSKLKYEEMWEILSICGITIFEFLKGIGVVVPDLMPVNADLSKQEYLDRRRFLSKEISDLYRTCDGLSDENRRKALFIAKCMSPVVLQSNIDDGFAIVNDSDFSIEPGRGGADEDSSCVTWKTRRFHGNPSKKIYWLTRRKEYRSGAKQKNNGAFWGDENWAVELFKRISAGKEWEKPVRLDDIPSVAICLDASLHEILCAPDELFLYATKTYTESIVSMYYFMSSASRELFRVIVSQLKEGD